MKTGIIGLPQVGKTSLFVMLTRQQVAQRSGNPREAHLGVAKVPDDRLDRLAAQCNPREARPRQRRVHRCCRALERSAERDRLRRESPQRRRAGPRRPRLRRRLHPARRLHRSPARHQEHRLRPHRQRSRPSRKAPGARTEGSQEDEVAGDRARTRVADPRQSAS